MGKAIKILLKIFLFSVTSLAALVLFIVFLTGMGAFNKFLPGIISRQTAGSINGNLNIGSLTGKLFSGIKLNNLRVVSGSDTIITVREIEIGYSLLPLFRKEISISRLNFREIHLFLKQDQDSVWNITKVLKESGEKDTASGEFRWKVSLNDLSAEQLVAEISPVHEDDLIPRRVLTNFRLNGRFTGDTLIANLVSLNISTQHPDFELTSLSGAFMKTGSLLSWNDLELKLRNSYVKSGGSYNMSGGNAEMNMSFLPLSFEDLKPFLPDLNLKGSPQIEISLRGDRDEYVLHAGIQEGTQEINASARLADVTGDPGYSVELIVANLDLSEWTGERELKTNISGRIDIGGKGSDIKTNDLNLDGSFSSAGYREYGFASAKIVAAKKGDVVSGSIDSKTFAGDASMKFSLSRIFGDPSFDLFLSYRNVNLDKIPGLDSIPTSLNGDIHFTGKGKDPGRLNVKAEVNSFDSNILGNELGDFNLTGSYIAGNYEFGLEGFGAPWILLNAEGKGNIDDFNDITFSLQSVDPFPLLALMGIDSAYVAGNISGTIQGNIDSIGIQAHILLDSLSYDTIRIAGIEAEADAGMVKKKISGNLIAAIEKISAGKLNIDSVKIMGALSGNTVEADIRVNVDDSLSASFSGSAEGFEDPLVRIRHLGIKYGKSAWDTPHDSATVSLKKDGINISKFVLASREQEIHAEGTVRFEGEENLDLGVNRLELSDLPLNYLLPFSLSGKLSLGVSIRGSASQPLINGRISAGNIEVAGYVIDTLASEIGYSNEMLSVMGKVSSVNFGSVEINGDLPVSISLTDTIGLLKNQQGFNAAVTLDSLDLNKILTLFPVENTSLSGLVTAGIRAGNTLGSPVIEGYMRISNAAVSNSEYGIAYNRINLSAGIDSGTIAIDTLVASTGKGKLAVQGYVSIENTDSLTLNDFQIRLKANDFQLAESNNIELDFDSDVTLGGTIGKPVINGKLEVNSSKLNVDYLGEAMSEKAVDPDPPLLIAALKDTMNIVAGDTASGMSAFSGSAFYKALTGEMTLDIPGNTWVTGKDMNFELEGLLRAVKKSEEISLFGDLNVKRGYYKLYGRSFDFSRGRISFTGASGFNPELDFEIIYSFRNIEKELKDLHLLISGKMRQPQLQFTLDNQVLEEKDAISYLVFGKSINQLGEGERDKISGEQIAMGAAMTQLSSALKNVLQESAGVDVFEVTGGEDWKSGSVTIGKYITKNLFLSYDRNFDFDKQSKTAANEKIMLEYQILRNLILKATNQEINSGFDLIFRKTWK